MSRWKVKSVVFDTFLLWSVFEGKYSSFSGTIEWHKRRAFNSWAEAMAYIDHMSRINKTHIPSEFSYTPAQLKQIETLLGININDERG